MLHQHLYLLMILLDYMGIMEMLTEDMMEDITQYFEPTRIIIYVSLRQVNQKEFELRSDSFKRSMLEHIPTKRT